MRALGHSGNHVEQLQQNSASNVESQESCQQLEWARGGENRQTTASAENLEIQDVEELKSSGQPNLGTAKETWSLVMEPSCDKVDVGGLKQYEEPAVVTQVLTPSV